MPSRESSRRSTKFEHEIDSLDSICFLCLWLIFNSRVLADETTTSEFLAAIPSENLFLAKELIFNSVSIVHWQSMVMIVASEKDFILNTSSTLIRYPHSYRATILQTSSELQRVFTDIDSLMYRLQLAMKRIPDYIRTVFRLLDSASTLMRERMMPSTLNNILRTTHENMLMMNATIQHWNSFARLFQDVKAVPIPSTTRTGLILADELDSNKMISEMDALVEQISQNLNTFLEHLVRLDQLATANNATQADQTAFVANLYASEQTAYFIYQTAFIFNHFSHRYLIYPLTSSSRYVILNSTEDRLNSFDVVSKRWSEIAKDINESLIQYELEYESNSLLLRQAYENMVR